MFLPSEGGLQGVLMMLLKCLLLNPFSPGYHLCVASVVRRHALHAVLPGRALQREQANHKGRVCGSSKNVCVMTLLSRIRHAEGERVF